jgi:tetratricopeptide (TPR) repeat protein
VLEYGELLQASGKSGAAAQQWQLFRTEERLFRANGVTLDVDQILFEADHGSPAVAVRTGARALRTRPFLDTHDAYAWALHRVGANEQALREADIALHTGMSNALFLFHRGEIERSLGGAEAARRDLSRALHLDPTFSPLLASQARAHLATLGGAAR